MQSNTPFRVLRDQLIDRVAYQADGCHDLELLAAVIRRPKAVELAGALLERFGDIHAICAVDAVQLQQVCGIGPATATSLAATFTLSRRLMRPPNGERPEIRSPADAAALLLPLMQHLEQEHLYAVLLDTRNRVHGEPVLVYHGSLNTAQIRVGEVFREAVRRNAASIIVAHNHPSGSSEPSVEDKAANRFLVEAGKMLDIPVLDHIVVGHGGQFVSLKEHGGAGF